MRRVMLYVLIAMFSLAGYVAKATNAQEMNQEKAPSSKELRWHGIIVRWSKDQSTLDVRKGNVTKTIHYDSSTQWTQAEGSKVKPAEMSEFTEGSDVICIGKAGEKGSFVATRIDLRTKATKP